MTGAVLSAEPAAAQTPPTAPAAAAKAAPTPPTAAAKPAAKPGDLIPRTLLGGSTPYGGDVPGRILAMAGDGQSATFHINPAKKPDGKPGTTLDQRRGHFGLAVSVPASGDFQYQATVQFLTLPDKVTDGWGVCVGLGVNGPRAVGNAGINRGAFELTGQSYHICRDIPNGGNMTWAYDNLPSKSKTVRLGIRRQGSDAILLAADGPAEPLVEVRRYKFTDQPVSGFAIYTTTGGGDYPLSAKVSDVKLLTGSALPPAPAKSRIQSVMMVPPHDPVATPAVGAVTSPGDLPMEGMPSPIRGGRWGLTLGAGLVGLLVDTLLGRWWGGRAEQADDE